MNAEVELLRSVVAIASESGSEQELVGFLAGRLHGMGFRTHVDAAGSVHGTVGAPDAADGPELMLLGHVDTVPGDVPVRLTGDVLHGRGTVDAKGPFAAMVSAAHRLAPVAAARGFRVTVVGAVDEERFSAGARHLLGRAAPGALVIGEPSGAASVGLGYKGVHRLRVRITCPGAHTSSAQPTAAEVAALWWGRAHALLTAPTADRPALFDRVQPTLVAATGDLEHAASEISCRVPPGFDAERATAQLRALDLGVDAAVELEVLETVPAVRARRTDPVVRALTGAVRDHGMTPGAKLKLGTADWNVVGPVWGVPTAAYGPGDSRLCHTADEHISLTEYLAAVDVLATALPRLAAALAPAPTRVPEPQLTGGTLS